MIKQPLQLTNNLTWLNDSHDPQSHSYRSSPIHTQHIKILSHQVNNSVTTTQNKTSNKNVAGQPNPRLKYTITFRPNRALC